ncbi:MAG: MG2 domain-containing protein [Candidatus Aminicenantes bacterium]|nr:MG2 domain-containing protein [Candidatus Aminicenantes bacterium]
MGKKTFLGFLSVCLVLAAVTSMSCKKKEPSRIPASASGEIKGDLQVLQVSPKGPTRTSHEAGEVFVIFDHPMAALEPLPLQEKTDFLKIEPAYAGAYRWMGTKTLAFVPKEKFPFATEIKLTVPAGTRSVDGYALKQDYTWGFKTIRPKLLHYFPQNEDKQQKLDTNVLLVFNQPVDERKAKDYVALTGVSQEQKDHLPGFSVERPAADTLKESGIQNPPENILLIKPAEKLRAGFAYSVEIRAGLPGKDGPLGMEEAAVFSFETFNPFTFESLESDGGFVPGEPLQFHFSNRVIYKDFVEKVRFEPKVEIPDYYMSWDHGNQSLYLSLPLQPETKYVCRIAADLKDEFGNVLGKEIREEFTTAPYAPYVSMTTGHGVLESYSDLTYPLFAVNTAQVRLQAARLNKVEVIPTLLNDKSLRQSESFDPRPGFFQIDRPLNFNLPRNKRQIVPINVKDLLGENPYGFVMIQLDTRSEDKWSRYPKAFLQVTGLGITGKFSPENNIVWVTDLKTGQPVAEAEVEIRDDTNIVRWTGKTDREGKAQTPGWKRLAGFKLQRGWGKPQQWVFVRRGNDIAFTSSEWGTGLDPYRFGINYDWDPEPEKIQGSIFTERGIYRAGEPVHIKGIIRKREQGGWQLPAVRTIACEVTDPFQKSVYKGRAELDAFGSFSLDLETREDAALGYYQIQAKVPPETPGEKETSLSESFRVEAFRAAEFEVHLRSLKDSFIFGDQYQAEVRASYLFGGAMAAQKANWTLRLNPAWFTPPGHKDFIFGSEIETWTEDETMAEKSRLIASGEGTLGPDGKIEIKAPLAAEKENATVSATLEATVQSPSRRSISNRIQTIVHQGEFYIGLKPNTSFLKKGENLALQVITTNPDGSPAAEKKVAVKLNKREWRSARKAGVGGRFQWLSEKVDTEIASKDVRTKNDPVEVAFQPDKSGLYFISATGQDSRRNPVATSTYIYVTGTDYVPWQRKDDDMLELVPNSDGYQPGDRARILVKSPYEKAKALVTIEREFILQTQVIDIVGSTCEIEIPITSDYIPNVFVSVLLVQGRTSKPANAEAEDVGKPSFKLGYVGLKVDPSEKRLAVDVTTEKQNYKPKDLVTLRLIVKDAKSAGAPASLAVAVVDVGVLNLIGYQTPDPFASFYGERPLSVQTSETRLHVVGQRNFSEKGENTGGGGIMASMAAPGLGEFELRGDFRSTAYWNPSIVTNDQGEATVQFTLPDNLTTFRIMAVAQTKDSRFGRGELNIKVAKPVMLLPSLPRFARVGDTFMAGVVVNNNSAQKGVVSLSVDAQGIVLTDRKSAVDLGIDPGRGTEVLFAFEADKPGQAKFTFRAKMGADTDGLELTIPIELPRPTESVATYDQVTEEAKEEKVSIPETIFPADSRIEVQAAASALAGLSGSVDYLTRYPYLCLEQRLSSILPYLVAPQVIQDFKLSALEPKEIKKFVQGNLREIYAQQKDNGGFGLWPDSYSESPFVSCYAIFGLMKAGSAGYEIDESCLAKGLDYLKRLVKAKPDESMPYSARSWKTTQAFALYDLAAAGRPEPAYAEKLYVERDSLSLFGRAYLLKALHAGGGTLAAQNTVLQELLNLIKVTAADAHFEEIDDSGLRWIYSSNARTTGLILQALLEVGSDHSSIPAAAKWLVSQRKTDHWQSTQENFFVFYALNDFYKIYEKGRVDFKADISLAKKTILKESFRSPNQTAKAALPLTEFKPGKELSLKIAKSGEGILYYGARLTYAPKQKLEPREEGFAVYKKIETVDGKPLDVVKAGTLVVVTLQVVVPKESLFIVVNDPLPAGFEAVNAGFLTESEEQQRKLDELGGEDERIWWQGFNHVEMHDNRVLLFADSLGAGIHTYRYLARALAFGRFTAPGSKAEQMYAPEVFGRSAEQTVKIVK